MYPEIFRKAERLAIEYANSVNRNNVQLAAHYILYVLHEAASKFSRVVSKEEILKNIKICLSKSDNQTFYHDIVFLIDTYSSTSILVSIATYIPILAQAEVNEKAVVSKSNNPLPERN